MACYFYIPFSFFKFFRQNFFKNFLILFIIHSQKFPKIFQNFLIVSQTIFLNISQNISLFLVLHLIPKKFLFQK